MIRFMKSKASDQITEVLDSIEALSQMEPKPYGDSAKDVLKALASYLESSYESVHSWIRQRAYKPGAETFLEMSRWNAMMLAKVKFNNSEKIGYRKALQAVKRARVT